MVRHPNTCWLIALVLPCTVAAQSISPTAHQVMADGHPLTIWEKRPQSPRGAILLVHGTTWSSLPNFDLQVPGEHRSLMDAFVRLGYAIYALDMRGYGATPRDSTGWLNPDRAAADVAIALEWLASHRSLGSAEGTSKPVLLGYSRGAGVSMLCTRRNPDKIAALVLFAFPWDPDTVRPIAAEPAQPPRRATTVERALRGFVTPGAISQRAIDVFVQRALKADPVLVDWRRDHQFNDLDPTQVQVPTLIIHGENDPYTPPERQATLFKRLGARDRAWVILPGADHFAHIEDSQREFVQAVVSFVERPRRTRQPER